MKIPLFLALVFAVSASAADVDSSAIKNDNWATGVLSEKPYRLELRYGETETPLSPGTDRPVIGREIIPTSEFLNGAKMISAAIAGKDAGKIGTDNETEFIYRIEKVGETFGLQLSLNIKEARGGNRSSNTRIRIPENEWTLVSYSARNIGGSPTRYFYVAVKIQKRD